MRYRGFELKPAEKHFRHGIAVKGIGIHRDGQCLTYAADLDLAKRVVDERIRRGMWKEEQRGDADKQKPVS